MFRIFERKFAVLALAALALIVLMAPMRAQSSTVASAALAASPTVDPGYVLGVGDKVHIAVYGESDLTGDYEVGSTGELHLPLIGNLKVSGLTLGQVEDQLRAKLSVGYLKDPRVSAEVINYRPFYIIGEVNKPGEYPYVNGMNILTAVALAGGYTYRADDSSVHIRRKGVAKEFSEPADQTTPVEPGDIIRVAERFF
jgi:protein involved in polysaccharide export with SLBB domain